MPLPRRLCATAVVASLAVLGACSTTKAPVHVTGLAGLGGTSSNWNATHTAIATGSTYGPTISTGAGTQPTYSAVAQSSGHVAGWVMAFASGTKLAAAEHALSHDLPPDTEQIASARQTRQSGSGVCEVVSYQSFQLRLAFQSDPTLGSGRFSVSFFNVQSGGSVATSYAKVNRAVVGSPSNAPNPTCP